MNSVLQAIKKHDPDAAGNAIKKHLVTVENNVKKKWLRLTFQQKNKPEE
jgi:DNA-binding FadR family transcriptional regulator